MKIEDCYQLGEVIKTHGLKGEVSILLDVDYPTAYAEMESVFVEQNGKLVPFFIDHIQINGNKALIGFEEIETLDQATLLVKCKLYLPLSMLPHLQEDQYYYHELPNCDVYEGETFIGKVKEVIDLNGNELLSVVKEDKEILIPIKDEIILKFDRRLNRLEVVLPTGLIDLYQ